MAAEPDDLYAVLRSFLRDVLGVDVRALDEHTSLVRTGLLDSVALVRLAAFLETRFGLVIPDRDVTPEHFDSLAAIEAYLQQRA